MTATDIIAVVALTVLFLGFIATMARTGLLIRRYTAVSIRVNTPRPRKRRDEFGN